MSDSHFSNADRDALHEVKDSIHEVKDKQDDIPREVKDYMTDRLNIFTLQLSEHLTQTIHGTVKATVNGKIDRLTNILEDHIEASKPSMDFIKDLQSTNRVMQYIFKITGLIAAFLGVLWAAFKFKL